jgi:hypothetical protein
MIDVANNLFNIRSLFLLLNEFSKNVNKIYKKKE